MRRDSKPSANQKKGGEDNEDMEEPAAKKGKEKDVYGLCYENIMFF